MAPIVLKVKGNMQSLLPFGNLDSSDDLSKTWRVCTKVKDSLENGSRLENLSWRLWFAHNVNNNTTKKRFQVPEDFDFKGEQELKKEIDYKRQLCLQQKSQLMFDIKKEEQQKQFTLHQYTSDQANDQVIELDDIFKSFGGSNMQAYLDPTEEQQLDNLINEAWPISSDSTLHSNATSPMNISFSNNNNESSAMYVSSSEAMPPIPIGTLHNKLLNTLPRETLESAGRLLSNETNDTSNDMIIDNPSYQYPLPQTTRPFHNIYHQSTPNTPFITSSSSFNTQQQQQQQQHCFIPPQQYTFSHHQPPTITTTTMKHHSKSLPPSRATSPPPCDRSSSSASSSPISPSISPQKRTTTAPINSSPSEGKAPICSNCGTASTPLWRRSANDELLCNACGLYLKLHNAPRPKYLKPQSSRKDQKGEDENIIQPLCSNCGTSTTPLWRRDLDGSSLCNACGLYLKLHHEKRPLSMKTDNIKKRQRCDTKSPISPTTSTTTNKKKNRIVEEPLTTTVTFDSTFTFDNTQPQQNGDYSPFGSFGLQLTNQPI